MGKSLILRFSLALSFLTVIPVNSTGVVLDEEMSKSVALFPIVGLLIGALNVGVYLIGLNLWGNSIAAWFWLIANALITGCLHLDGWMDTFDALGSRKGRDDMLAIMRDSRIGAMGGVAAILLIGLKWSLLTQMGNRIFILLLAPLVGRATVLLATQVFTYARTKGLGHTFSQPLALGSRLMTSVVVLVALFALGGASGVLAGVLALGLSLAWAVLLTKKFGGLTGDNYGALNEAAELIFLMIMLSPLGVLL